MTEFKKKWLPYKWELIVLLWFAFLINMADRQAYNVVLPLLSKDLNLTPDKAGLVASIFLWFYAVLVPVGGFLGDIARRKWVVFFSLLIWSIGTVMSGLTTGLVGLIAFRSIATGGGEAFYFPSANSLIGQHHQKTRALAMSIHQTALYVGIIASGLVAGWMGKHFGWRSPFVVFGGIGVALALVLAWRMRDDPQPAAAPAARRIPLGELLRAIAGKPTVWALWLAFGFFYFTQMGYITWMTTYLYEKYQLSLPNAGFSSMFYHHIFAALGVLLGGKISDMLATRRRTVRIETEFVGLFFGAPFIFFMGATDSLWLCCASLAGFGLFRGIYDSNLFASLFDVIKPQYRATATGLMLSFAFLVGSFSPTVLGFLKSRFGLSFGLASLSVSYVLGGIIILIACALFFRKDYEEAKA